MQDKISHIKSYSYTSTDLQKLREDMYRKIDFLFDQFLQNSRVIEILPANNSKIPWLKGEEGLFIFYELLVTHRYIDCNFTFFQAHFMGNETTPDKIIFLKPTNQLPYIIDELVCGGYISECEDKHIRLGMHFLSQFQKPITNGVLRSSLNKGVGKKAKQFIEENILNALKKHIG